MVTPSQLHELLARHRGRLDAQNVASLDVFGSVARGDAREDSDVDILVTFTTPATFDRFMDLKLFLEDTLGRRVDLVTRGALREALRPHVEAELKRVA